MGKWTWIGLALGAAGAVVGFAKDHAEKKQREEDMYRIANSVYDQRYKDDDDSEEEDE